MFPIFFYAVVELFDRSRVYLQQTPANIVHSWNAFHKNALEFNANVWNFSAEFRKIVSVLLNENQWKAMNNRWSKYLIVGWMKADINCYLCNVRGPCLP